MRIRPAKIARPRAAPGSLPADGDWAARRRVRVAAALLLLALALSLAGRVGRDASAETLPLRFAAPPAKIQLSSNGRSLLVEFPGPLKDGEAERTATSLGPLITGYAEGWGAVRYDFDGPVRAERNAADPAVIDVTPLPSTTKPADVVRLVVAQSRQQAQDGDVDGARRRLEALAGSLPTDPDPPLALAAIEADAGRWQHALGVYDSVLGLLPEAADIARDRLALARRSGPLARLDSQAFFGPNGERVQTGTLLLETPLDESTRAGLSLQVSHDQTRDLRRSGEATAADYGGTKLITDLDVVRVWGPGIGTTRVDLVTAPRTLGFRLQHQLNTALGETTFAAVYHQPFWGTVMSFAADARRDQVGAVQDANLPGRWQVQFGLGLVRYGLPGNDDVAAGPSLSAGVSKGLPETWMPLTDMQTRLGWRVEAEYLGTVRTGPTAAGFLPLLDIRRRETHSLYAESTVPIGPGTLTTLAGYAVDRFGGSGPEALVRYSAGGDGDRFAFGAEAGLEPSLDLRPRTLFHVGAFAVWRFGRS